MVVYRRGLFVWVILVCLCLVALSTVTAVSIFSQQRAVTLGLQENVRSQRTAVELEECLKDIIALEDARVELVAVLHDRVQHLLAAMNSVADQVEEQVLLERTQTAFQEYQELWQMLPPPNDLLHEEKRREATRYLERDVLKPCQEFESFNTGRVTNDVEHHERVLRQLSWGLAGVGILGGIAGVTLGYGVARGLAKSLQRLHVQVRDASGKLGPNLPEIVVTGEGNFAPLHAEIELLTARIETVVRNLQEREHEVLRAEQLAAIGQLAAGVAHEIRNPLTSIKLLVQAGQVDGEGMSIDDLRVIESEVRRMERSLNTFLDFARPPKLRRENASLVKLAHDVLGLLRMRAEKQQVCIHTDFAAENVEAIIDPEQLRQVLMNLVLNALDAMPSGGDFTLRIHPSPDGSRIELELIDSGSGIAPAMLPRLFQPFASSKETGLGLGLVISKRIIEDHRGTISAANRTGGGASIFVTLPTETDSCPISS